MNLNILSLWLSVNMEYMHYKHGNYDLTYSFHSIKVSLPKIK